MPFPFIFTPLTRCRRWANSMSGILKKTHARIWQAAGEQMSYEWWEIASSADGHIQYITTESLITGTVREYQLTWENGDMTGYTMHTIQPEEETLVVDIEYDEYPNVLTGMPLTSSVFDPQMIASRSSVHNWMILGYKHVYANGLLVKKNRETAVLSYTTYYTYSDGTTGKE